MPRLYTFAISHFSEKARWGLGFAGVAVDEKILLPGPHQVLTRRIAPRSTVPVLEHDGNVIQGSSAILDYARDHLGATKLVHDERAAAWEAKADLAFGTGTQRIFYDVLLKHRPVVVDMWSQKGPFWAPALYAVAWPFIVPNVRKLYKIRPDKVEEAKDLFRRTFDETDAVFGKQPYFFGDAPSRTDIAVASLLAPLCTPPEHIIRWPALPDEAKPFVAEFEGRPTWEFVRRLYREHRRAP